MADTDIAGRFVVDGRFVDDGANVRVSGGKLEFYNSDGTTRRTVYEAIRLGKGVTQADLTFRTGIDAGIILHYQDPENFMVALLDDNGSGTVTPRLAKYADGKKVDLLVSGGTFSLTDNTTYAVKCAVDDDAGNSALQELKLYVGGTLRLTTTLIDDTWSAGKVGFFRASGTSGTTIQWDNFKCGLDRSAPLDQDIDDAGTDWVYATCDFNDPGGSAWQKLTLSYDDNGNLTNDGLRKFKYDAWNRLRAATYSNLDPNDPNQWIADYRYYADTRRARKIVQNRGIESVPNDGGDTVIDFYYDDQWRVVEERNGSNQAVRQYCFGTQYTDEIVFMDVNTEPSDTNDCDPDVDTGGERADERYFYHQDRNWNVVALTGYNTNPSDAANGAIVERYAYTTPYGEFVVLGGTTGSASSEAGPIRAVSAVGGAFAHQGIGSDAESSKHVNRWRMYDSRLGRFLSNDPFGYVDSANRFQYLNARTTHYVDPHGLLSLAPGAPGMPCMWPWPEPDPPPRGVCGFGWLEEEKRKREEEERKRRGPIEACIPPASRPAAPGSQPASRPTSGPTAPPTVPGPKGRIAAPWLTWCGDDSEASGRDVDDSIGGGTLNNPYGYAGVCCAATSLGAPSAFQNCMKKASGCITDVATSNGSKNALCKCLLEACGQ